MTKPVIINRVTKGAALTYAEHDANFANLQNATIGVTDGTNTHAFNLNDTITFTAGTNITLGVNPTTGAITINSGAGGTITAGHGGFIPIYTGSIGSTSTSIEESDLYTTNSGLTWNGTDPNDDFQITIPATGRLTVQGGLGLAVSGTILGTTITASSKLNLTARTSSDLNASSGIAGDVAMVITGSSALLVYWDNNTSQWKHVHDNSAI